NKIYDGNTAAEFATNLLTLLGDTFGADVSIDVDSLVAAFADANVDDDIVVSLTAALLEGADADNFTLTLTGSPTTLADITPKDITLAGTWGAANKDYD